MPFVVLKIIRRIICRKKFRKKFGEKKIRENISKILAKKSQNPLNLGKKIPESREKLPGFSNPKNLRTLFSE
jgi:hypothetical protein